MEHVPVCTEVKSLFDFSILLQHSAHERRIALSVSLGANAHTGSLRKPAWAPYGVSVHPHRPGKGHIR